MSAPANIAVARVLRQRDTWPGLTVTWERAAFDFTGATVTCELRAAPGGTALHTFTLTPDVSVVGECIVTAALTSAESALLPAAVLYGDLILSHASLGTYTAVTFQLTVVPWGSPLASDEGMAEVTVNLDPDPVAVTVTIAAGADNGWTPILAVVSDGERRVLRVTDWTGGGGVEPATGLYVGAAGLVAEIADAVDVRGAAGPEGDRGDQGPQGDPGDAGAAGANGKTVLNGTGAPAGGLGVDGDFYVDTAALAIYGPKASGVWGSGTSLVGPQGPQGDAGADGDDGAAGTPVELQVSGTNLQWRYEGDVSWTTLIDLATLGYVPKGRVHQLWVDAGAMVPAVTNGAEAETWEYPTQDHAVDRLLFDAATAEAAFFKLALPKVWDLGTLKAKFVWDGAATASNGVVWGLSAGAFSNDAAIDAALGSEVTVADTVIAVGDLHLTAATAALTVGGTPAAEDLLLFKVRRVVLDDSDTCAVDAALLGVWLEWTEGSTEPVAW